MDGRYGLSNPEVGAQLFVSAHRPLPPEKGLIKLGIESRNQLGRVLPIEPLLPPC